ncbi:MAG TPA: uracil-DNA glycosylase [Vicinamibacterales bacterium]|nr:uracil-DNA glycosylase [Vicinamibacterales bacterium]
MTRDQIKAHLEFFGELGVDGVRLEPEWRTRPHAIELERGNSELRNSELGTSEPGNSELGNSHEPVGVFTSQADALKALRTEIGPDCSRCKLHTLGRKHVVFGVGNPNADLMFVGEGPGADEDIQGEPFVGRAGQLLTKIIEAIGLTRDSVYIANVIKCRPPGNRNPEPDEVDTCEPFLFRQIDIIKPKVIVALGKFAAQSLLRTTDPITRIRGREYKYRDAILMPTYHPAYLLRNPASKRDVWEDMKRVRAILAADE